MSLGCLFCKSSLRLVWLAEWALWIVGKSHVHDPNVCDRNKLHVHLLSLLFSGILSIQERGFLTGASSFYLSHIVLIIFVFQICFFAKNQHQIAFSLNWCHFSICKHGQYGVSKKLLFLILQFPLDQSCQMMYKYTTKSFKFKDP